MRRPTTALGAAVARLEVVLLRPVAVVRFAAVRAPLVDLALAVEDLLAAVLLGALFAVVLRAVDLGPVFAVEALAAFDALDERPPVFFALVPFTAALPALPALLVLRALAEVAGFFAVLVALLVEALRFGIFTLPPRSSTDSSSFERGRFRCNDHFDFEPRSIAILLGVRRAWPRRPPGRSFGFSVLRERDMSPYARSSPPGSPSS